MLWLSGLHALDLTTSTPDALCPPLEEARAAVKARVGEVRGEFHAEFGLVRRDDGRQALELRLREGVEPVLRRELPLDDSGCDDAAQAIALVLERYFDALETPPAEPAPQSSVPVTANPTSQVVAVESAPAPLPAREQARVASSHADGSKKHAQARAGLLYDGELGIAPTVGVTLYPRAFELSSQLRIGAALDVTAFLRRRTQTVREQGLTLTTLQAAFSLPLTLSLSSWAVSVGPWAHWRLQRAQPPSDLRGSTQYRALPGVGGFAHVGFTLGPRWSLGGGVAFGGQLRESAVRFVLQKDNGERIAVLVPDPWFAQAQLGAAFGF